MWTLTNLTGRRITFVIRTEEILDHKQLVNHHESWKGKEQIMSISDGDSPFQMPSEFEWTE